MYFCWTLRTVAEIFNAHLSLRWITGIPTVWNDRNVITKTSHVKYNYFTHVCYPFRCIQQESTFWKRSLWEEAGGYINSGYNYMVDSELWSRFFLLEKIYNVEALLGGFRNHSSSMSKVFANKCVAEHQNSAKLLKFSKQNDLSMVNKINKIILLNRNKFIRPFVKLFWRLLPDKNKANFFCVIYSSGEWKLEERDFINGNHYL